MKKTTAPPTEPYQPTLQDALGSITLLAGAIDTLYAQCAAQDETIAGLHAEIAALQQDRAAH